MYSFHIKLVVDYRRGLSNGGKAAGESGRGTLLVSFSGRFILQYIGLGQISIITLACLSIRSDGIECQFDWRFWVEFG